MKNYLRLALAIFLTVAFTEIHAQMNSGYVFGLNMSTMKLKSNGISYPAETPVGIHFGGFFEIPLSSGFSVHTSFLLSAKGSNYIIDTLDVTLSPVYFDIPVNVLYRFGSKKNVKFSLFAGPYVACGIGGYKIVSGGQLKDIRYGSGGNHDLRPFDIGYNLGAGIKIRSFVISVLYETGLANISPVKTYNTEMKNKVFAISISSGNQGFNTKFGR